MFFGNYNGANFLPRKNLEQKRQILACLVFGATDTILVKT